ncbi:galactose-1-epimerase [Vibrio algicola]
MGSLSLPCGVEQLHTNMSAGVYLDGLAAKVITLSNQSGMTATFMDVGATWLSCTVPVADQVREVLLGVDTIEKFQQQTCFLGASVGRYANRIAGAQFELNGQVYSLSQNHEKYCIHGGEMGFDKRRWTVVSQSQDQVVFELNSADGDQGFPGNMQVQLSYTLTDDNQVSIDYQAKVDKACPINLTNHAYFNLQGAKSGVNCLEHKLTISAEQFLASDENSLPTRIKSVVNTGFDFQTEKTLQQDFLFDDEQKLAAGYDHAFIFSTEHLNQLKQVASVVSPDDKVSMHVFTTKPAMQVYSGNYLAQCPSREEAPYQTCDGFALETQYLPDAPNHPEWTFSDSIVQPDQSYHHTTVYQFSF